MEFYFMLKWHKGKMGEATAHFQCGVATLQFCCESRGHNVHGRCACAHDQGPVRAYALARQCLGRTVTTGLLGRFVTTENSLSRQRRPALCHDRGCPIVTGFL